MPARVLGASVLLVGLGLTVAACGGATKEVVRTETAVHTVTTAMTVTVTTTEPLPDAETVETEVIEGPDASDTATASTDDSGAQVIERPVGGAAEDDGILFSVKSISEVDSVQMSEYSDPAVVTAVKGAKLILAVVSYKNNTKQAVDPFCGNGGTVLIDAEGRNFDPIESIYEIAGNEVCSDGVQPGFKDTVKIAYQIPKEAIVSGIALWNDDTNSPDWGGEQSYIVFYE